MHSYNSVFIEQNKVIERLNGRINYLTKKSNGFSKIRLLVFLAGLIISIAGYFISKEIGWVLTILSVAAFAVTVHLHNKLLEGIRSCYSYMKIKEENLARLKVDWKNIPDPINNYPPLEMSAERDLDLTGKYSLHNLIDIAVSGEGSTLLRKWISGIDPNLNAIIERQKLIKELSGMDRFRDRFVLKARLVSRKILNCQKIIDWLQDSEKIDLPERILYIAAAMIFSYISLFILNQAGMISSVWIIVLVLYFFLNLSNQKKIKDIIEDASDLESQLKKFSALVLYIEKYSYKNQPNLNTFLNIFKSNENSAASKLKSLQKIISAFLIIENPFFAIILNLFFPYNIYFSLKLIKLKSEIRDNIEVWCNKLNELECYISIANFSYLNPEYVFPEISENTQNTLEVKKLGHPLISSDKKVCNDFKFDKQNEIVIITGSNMSGKSTFLRSVGINLCLAYAGSPVNAEKFNVSLYDLFTCIKVSDSVVDGISYFYAEVTKLKTLLDKLESGNGLSKFFLIDEIFKGTNNKERLTGSRAFIKELANKNATGFVTTHDLELINLEKEIPVIENYHFREEIVNHKMEFDYKIHIGPCPTTNALKIMKLAGLPVE